MMSYILFIMTQSSDPYALHRISIQITKSQYELLKEHSRPGTSISELIRRSVDNYFQPLMEQALENAKYEKWEKEQLERESLQNKNVVSESLTTNAAS
jgi:hypothetical protein